METKTVGQRQENLTRLPVEVSLTDTLLWVNFAIKGETDTTVVVGSPLNDSQVSNSLSYVTFLMLNEGHFGKPASGVEGFVFVDRVIMNGDFTYSLLHRSTLLPCFRTNLNLLSFWRCDVVFVSPIK